MTDPRYLTPKQWGAKSVGVKPQINVPVKDVFIHHTVTTPSIDPIEDAQFVESIGIQRFGRLSYSWLVHPDGTVIEGQGKHRGAHTVDEKSQPGKQISRNYDGFGIAAIGDYTKHPITPDLMRGFQWLISKLRAEGLVVENHGVLPHSAMKATACPGKLGDVIPQMREGIMVTDLKLATDFGMLKLGDMGTAVKRLQRFLRKRDLRRGDATGVFDESTDAAVRIWQTMMGVTVDGIWGPQTTLASEEWLAGEREAQPLPEPPAPAPPAPEPAPPAPTPAPAPTIPDDMVARLDDAERNIALLSARLSPAEEFIRKIQNL